MGIEEIARQEQFLLFPQCFQKTSTADMYKPGLVWERVNSLPNDKTLDVTKLKAFADNKINVGQMMISVFDRVENIVGKGENAGYQHFLIFPQCFQKASFSGLLKFQGR